MRMVILIYFWDRFRYFFYSNVDIFERIHLYTKGNHVGVKCILKISYDFHDVNSQQSLSQNHVNFL